MRGLLASLNIRGWGITEERELVWNRLAATRVLIAVITDHHRNISTQLGVMKKVTMGWIGIGMNSCCKWAHAPAKNKTVEGVTVGVHPILARYTITMGTHGAVERSQRMG
jgi:hypothetical protein